MNFYSFDSADKKAWIQRQDEEEEEEEEMGEIRGALVPEVDEVDEVVEGEVQEEGGAINYVLLPHIW